MQAIEKKTMEEIINLAHDQAASSFSSLTGQNVTMKKAHVELCEKHDYLINNFDHLKDITVLQTDIIGELPGASYLIFNEAEKKTVSQMSLATFGSNSTLDDSVILMEIDNILSATVITELANALKLNIYGDVPKLFELEDIKDFHAHINQGNTDHYILTNTNFIFEDHSMISPIFIWKMNKNIIAGASTKKIVL